MFKLGLVGRTSAADPQAVSPISSPYGFEYRGVPIAEVPEQVLDDVIRWTLDTYGEALSRAESIELAGWVLGFERVTREKREVLRAAYHRVLAA